MLEPDGTEITPEEFDAFLAELRTGAAERVRLRGPIGIPVLRNRKPDLLAPIAPRTKELTANLHQPRIVSPPASPNSKRSANEI